MQSKTNYAKVAKRKHHPHFVETSAFISIEKSIIDELSLTEDDSFTEEVTKEGILLRREIKQNVF